MGASDRNRWAHQIGIGGRIIPEYAAKVVISLHPRRSKPLAINLDVYKWQHLIENFFCKLKESKRIALRSDKTDTSFTAMIYVTAAVINSR